MFKFENLEVWKKALSLTKTIHDLTRKFPKEELFILTAQIKRAADSVGLNIAEGSTGQSNAEFRLFLGYSVRSALEVVACLFIGEKRGVINTEDFKRIVTEAETLIKMLQALRKSLK
jgi:four helix bundle protein